MSDLDKEELEATRNMQSSVDSAEKTADEMFETLHYLKRENENMLIYAGKETLVIFYLRTKWVDVTNIINLKELQAINKKCKELGWLDE